MRFSGRHLYEELKKTKNEEEIYKYCEFSKERFIKNLEKEECGDIDQLVLKQYYLLLEMLPVNFFN